ncbi:hypothetical protein SAMN05216360_104289 [Methylobacterium phyllostachyos]|uniref:Uncharacterized protein n=1 Tax=Methylobacterium phyllostachyos TaxID=582672 RepID=A0A1G9X808_9HYPH|nr:hypothetical protein [Methylobacterium phyllostachyos]SDM92919.1 hypothetical protein SAMN05216360_104289 [Methylobacterium phyllostachyos]
MRASLASLVRDETTSSAVRGANARCGAPGTPKTDFPGEIAAAAAVQVFAEGLAEMWATRPATGGADSRALLASITNRADILALRAIVKAGQPGAAGGFTHAAVSIRDLAARRIRAADALTRRFARLGASQG